MNSTTIITPGGAKYAATANTLIYESSHELLNFMFADRATAEETLRKLYAYQHGHFSYRFSTLAIQDNQVVGLQLGYDLNQLAQQEFIGSLLLFFNSPTKQWWPLVKKISPILADYVPKPASNAYYINNIAVSSSCRGGGIGKLLLANTLKHAELSGYQCVELDVTSVNEAAIRFYEKNGFVTVSTSGNETLHNNNGLPPLIRMQHRFQDETLSKTIQEETNPLVINDVTALNPTKVSATFTPGSIEQLQILLTNTSLPVSIGGGRFSMGGQIAAKDSLHIDMRGLNHILQFNPQEKVIRVQSGIRWCDIQSVIDAHGLAIKIMQTYSDFTVGGAVSVNCHGRYIGLGPLVLSIRSLQVMLHDGELIETSSTIRPEIFYGVVGGYGALGIITEIELDLTENTRVERSHKKLDIKDYVPFFRDNIRNNPNAVFHNADFYPPHYKTASAVTWSNTDSPVTTKDRLNPRRQLYLAEKYFMWAITETPFGKWRREHIIDPIIYARKKVHWRNYEAGYNVQELEPLFRDKRTYVLQEYFIPVDHFLEFMQQLTEILQRHHVNTVNISVRHAHPDTGCYLTWAREEMFAFVLYYKQRTRFNAKQRVAVWTRELVNAALNLNGSYYLPYQPHATASQFHVAYKNAEKLFAMKRQLDPNYRFRNSLWDKYYKPSEQMAQTVKTSKSNIQESEFHTVYQHTEQRDNFYRFLQNIYHIYPEDRFHTLIMQACARFDNDQSIYAYIQNNLANIKPLFSDLTYALPALRKQKQIIAAQTTTLLDNRENINGYLEIGSTGRYVNSLKKITTIQGNIYLTNDNPPDFSPSEIMERGQFPHIGQYFDMQNYAPINESSVPSSRVDIVTCYIGLHHCPPEKLAEYVASIHRILTDNGLFILRDHDAGTKPMQTFVSLVHTVFNAGLNVDWNVNQSEERQFNGIQYWADYMTTHGFEDVGARILQDNDPSLNTLMAFRKIN